MRRSTVVLDGALRLRHHGFVVPRVRAATAGLIWLGVLGPQQQWSVGTTSLPNASPLMFCQSQTNVLAVGSAFTCVGQNGSLSCVEEFQFGTPVLASPELPATPVSAPSGNGSRLCHRAGKRRALFRWGMNGEGQIGDGTDLTRHLSAVEVRFPYAPTVRNFDGRQTRSGHSA